MEIDRWIILLSFPQSTSRSTNPAPEGLGFPMDEPSVATSTLRGTSSRKAWSALILALALAVFLFLLELELITLFLAPKKHLAIFQEARSEELGKEWSRLNHELVFHTAKENNKMASLAVGCRSSLSK